MIRHFGYLCLILCLGFAVVALPTAPLLAQGQHASNTPDYVAWEDLAASADEMIERAEATSAELESMRSQISGWRQQFLDMQGANATAIKTVQDQLASLGPVPENGEESEDVTAQRDELKRRLARLQAPAKLADLARSRAEGLILGIDAIIRTRQTEELLRLGPSPVNPLHWPEAAKTLFRAADTIRSEVGTNWQSAFRRDRFKDSLPVIFVLTFAGLLLIARGREWSNRLSDRILHRETSAGRWIVAFLISLGEWLLPFAGVYALTIGIRLTGLLGPQGLLLLGILLPAAFIFLLARWLALRIFPRDVLHIPLLRLEEGDRYTGRLCGAMLGLVVAAFYYLQHVAEGLDWSEESRNVIIFPVLVLASLLLWRLARLLFRHSRAMREDEGSDDSFRDKLARVLARALWALAILSPLLAAIGYVSAADAMMLPALLSLMLMAALLLLQRVLTEVYIMLNGNRDGAEDSLVPVLAGFVLVLASVPIFALIWGARPAQLHEAWLRFTQGVSLGGITISPTGFLTLAVVFTLGYLATRLIQGALKNSVLPKTRLDTGGRNAVVSGVGYVGIFLAALIAVTSAGIDLSSLAIVAGALSVGIGFGLQNIVSNFVSGIILLIERPISEGDWIEVGGQQGYVRSISVRSTRIETFDRTDVIVPNADFVSGTVTNYTRGNTVGRVIVPVGVAYGTDTRRVEKILRDVAEAHPMVLMNPPPGIIFQGFGASSLDFEIRAILRDVNWVMSVKSDMNHEIARRFAEEGIEIPFPQQDVWFRNPETLATKQSSGATFAVEARDTGANTAHPTETDFEVTKGESDAGGDGDGR
ncbi:Small-conductance mechanosensitive channel [Roseovarius azorensis]|uniref:Small-conductance mechanosensitive channel n=1 Tax=Roseovarius azorensis TaxID=1287727 RepID=A0A1H7HW34_9RHOB|nr:DUF3772 domain-containing protein [Roseovarius azorensis]SEK54563.1 Small-conductance mechanosensitive channel [Roseovarius azorensis]